MKKFTHFGSLSVLSCFFIMFTVMGTVSTVEAAKKKVEISDVAVPSQMDRSADSSVRLPGVCGGDFFRSSAADRLTIGVCGRCSSSGGLYCYRGL